MKRLFCAVLCAALLLTLAACGASGRYVLDELRYDGQSIEVDDLMKDDSYYIELSANGTAVLYMEGQAVQMKWDDSHIWAEGEEDSKAELVIKGDELTISIDETKMIFEKD